MDEGRLSVSVQVVINPKSKPVVTEGKVRKPEQVDIQASSGIRIGLIGFQGYLRLHHNNFRNRLIKQVREEAQDRVVRVLPPLQRLSNQCFSVLVTKDCTQYLSCRCCYNRYQFPSYVQTMVDLPEPYERLFNMYFGFAPIHIIP